MSEPPSGSLNQPQQGVFDRLSVHFLARGFTTEGSSWASDPYAARGAVRQVEESMRLCALEATLERTCAPS